MLTECLVMANKILIDSLIKIILWHEKSCRDFPKDKIYRA